MRTGENKCHSIFNWFSGDWNYNLSARSHARAAEYMSQIPGTWQHQLNIACQCQPMQSRARWDQGLFLWTQNPHHATPPPSLLFFSSSSSLRDLSSRAELELFAKSRQQFIYGVKRCVCVCVSLSEDFTSNWCWKHVHAHTKQSASYLLFHVRLQSKCVPRTFC